MNPKRCSLLFPVLILLVVGGVIGWLFAMGHFMRGIAVIMLVPLGLILIGLWWALGGGSGRLRRLLAVTLVGAGIVFGGRWMLRYEGSYDGTALPKFAWRWSKQVMLELPVLENRTTDVTDIGPAPDGLADWPRFMGPDGNGILPHPEWKMDWATYPPREVWRQPVGAGWSGFAVVGRRAITQEQRGESECVTCYDLVTGRLLWSHADKAQFSEALGGIGPRATPAIAPQSGLVFTFGATGILNSLEAATGKLRWSQDVLKEASAANLEWGKSSSPVLVDGNVIVSGGKSAPTLLAYQQDTGGLVWKSGDDGASYSTPVVLTLAGRRQIVSVNQHSVTGHDVATGTQLWRHDWPGDRPKVGQPCAVDDSRFLITASYAQKSHLLEIKTGEQGLLQCTVVWNSSSPRTKFSSATVVDGHAFALDEGTLAVVNLAAGGRGWRAGRFGFGQHLQLGKEHLLIQSEPGDVVLVRATPESMSELGRIKALTSKTWNPPTLAGRWLLVRNDREAVCYELP